MIEERKPDASLEPSFAERVAVMETMLVDLDHSSMAQTTKLLLACIREQRAALGAMLTQFGMDEDEWSAPTFKQARAVLAKWRIE